MTIEVFLTVIIAIQGIFIALDVIYAKRTRALGQKNQTLKTSSFFFLLLVALVYGIIQFGGIALIPKTESIIAWVQEIIPSIHSTSGAAETMPSGGLLILGIFGFYVSGFWDYIIHRFFSHSKAIFFTHEHHHLPNRLFLPLPGLSVRPFVAIATLPAIFGTTIILVSVLKIFTFQQVSLMPLFYIIVLTQSMILALTHSEFFKEHWWMYKSFRYLGITSPQEHEIHHTIDLRGNYGNFTMIWDKIFGTYIDPARPENQNHALGLAYDQDFLGALTAGKIKFSKKVRDKFQIGKYCNLEDGKES